MMGKPYFCIFNAVSLIRGGCLCYKKEIKTERNQDGKKSSRDRQNLPCLGGCSGVYRFVYRAGGGAGRMLQVAVAACRCFDG